MRFRSSVVALGIAVLVFVANSLFAVTEATASTTQADTYTWPSVPCESTGATTGTCAGYNWGATTCPTGDGYCSSGKVVGYMGFTYYSYDQWGYQFRNCTSYVAEKISQEFNGRSVAGWGDAASWASSAQRAGYSLDPVSAPEVGDIGVWSATATNSFGHVAYVYATSGSTAYFDEYNQANTGAFSTGRSTAANSDGVPNLYIHMGTPADAPTSGSSGSSSFNGDGVADLAWHEGTTMYMFTGASSGTFSYGGGTGGIGSATWAGAGKLADGKTGVFLYQGSNVNTLEWTGSSWGYVGTTSGIGTPDFAVGSGS